MSVRNRGVPLVVLLVLVALAGCGALVDGGREDPIQQTATETITPAPVPEVTASRTATRTQTVTTTADTMTDTDATTGYAGLVPTCERPPGLVVYIQVGALAANDPETNDGIRTTWRFAAPSNKEATGPYSNFERLITTSYRPLLTAQTVTLGAVDRTDTSASRNVTVTTETGNATTYRWRLGKQSDGRVDGCWMTTSVQETSRSPVS
jgi:hypothetical protein